MLRSNPSAAVGGCTAVEAVSILRGSGRPLILPVAQKAKNLGVWGRAPEAAESGNTFLFRHLKSLIVAEPRQFGSVPKSPKRLFGISDMHWMSKKLHS